MTFTFYTEDGEFNLEYQDYLKRPDLMEKLHDKRRFFLNLGLRLFSFDRQWMKEHPKHAAFLESLQTEYEANPLRFFLPHCANSPDFDTQSHRFINDADHIYTCMLAGNRFGKSTIAFIKALVTYGVIPCDPSWEIFKNHGVQYREWTGPKEIAVCSINWNNITDTVWPQIARAWLPRAELADKALWNPPKQMAFSVTLKCGSIIHFKCARQPQSAFESQALDGAVWDEQGMEANFDGMEFRMKTRRRYSKGSDGYEYLTSGFHICGATPHKVDGRADTGGGTWFEAMYNGSERKGLTARFYEGSLIDDEPDWVYPEREKATALEALDEALRVNNKKQVRALESRLYGKFETTGGMVYDEWDDEVHVVDDFEIPSHWSAIRCMDHGRTNPTSCLWKALAPNGDEFVYREYLKAEKSITDNVRNIVMMSGNELEYLGEQATDSGYLERYREKVGPDGEQYILDVIDGRTFKSPDNSSRLKIGDLYRTAGLQRLRPAPIQTVESTIPLVKELLRIDPQRIHWVTKKPGAPKLYVFRSCVNLIKHIKGYRNKEDKTRTGAVSEKPHSKDDHDIDALRYGAMCAPRHNPAKPYKVGGKETGDSNKERTWWVDEDEMDSGDIRRRRADRFTGY